MANDEHLSILRKGILRWNGWRRDYPEVRPDLTDADLSGTDFSGRYLDSAYLSSAGRRCAHLLGEHLGGVNFSGADLSGTDLIGANLSGGHLNGAHLNGAHLNGAHLNGAHLNGAHLSGAGLSSANLIDAHLNGAHLNGADLDSANLTDANLTDANLTDASLMMSTLVRTNLERATLVGCHIYGASTWGLRTTDATQKDLVITPYDEPAITVDDIEVAQFIYLLLNNQKLRNVIETVTSKVVLILGNFKPDRKAILDGLREELRKRDKLPVIFDFDGPATQNVRETVGTLARLAHSVIADVTEARSIAGEIEQIVPHLRVPIQFIFHPSLKEARPYGMSVDFNERDYWWVSPVRDYADLPDLIQQLDAAILPGLEAKAARRRGRNVLAP